MPGEAVVFIRKIIFKDYFFFYIYKVSAALFMVCSQMLGGTKFWG